MDTEKRQRVVLGLGHSPFATSLAAELRQKGWDVATASNGESARRAAVRRPTEAIVVPFESCDELATAKVISATPDESRVILVATDASDRAARFAALIGVIMAVEAGGVAGIVSAVEGAMLLKA